MGKNPNGTGTDARRRKDHGYETRATLDTPTGRRRVAFYGRMAKEANDQKFAALADQAAASTYGRYERTVRNHFLPFFGRMRLRDLFPSHVRALKARRLDAGMDPSTAGVMQGVPSAALNQAVHDGFIARRFHRPEPLRASGGNPCGRDRSGTPPAEPLVTDHRKPHRPRIASGSPGVHRLLRSWAPSAVGAIGVPTGFCLVSTNT
jgi:hypothetical protein